MHVETASSLFDMRGSRKLSRLGGGGGGHLQTRVGPALRGPATLQLSRHKSIKMGRSWHRFLKVLLVHSEARTRFDDINKHWPSNTWIIWVVFSIKPRKNDG